MDEKKKMVGCPQCKHQWEVEVSETRLKCPKCGKEFMIFYLGGLRG